MKSSRHRARYDDHDGEEDDNSSVSSSEQQHHSDGEDSAGPEALRRLQRKLTAAMEHMERAQLEFFHVERAFQENKQQGDQQLQNQQYEDKTSVPWSLKVQLYCEFWQQFVVQLRSALRGGGDDNDGDAYDNENNERAIQTLSELASSVWGETRTPPQEVFRNGLIVLTPRTRRRPLVHQEQHKRRVASQRNSTAAVAFSGIGPHQDVAQWASKVKPAVQSLKSSVSSPAAAAVHSKTTTTTDKISNSGGKAAAHITASRPRKKVKTSTSKESTAAGSGAVDKTTTARGVNGAKQSSASYGPSNGVQCIADKSRASEAPASTSAKTASAKTREASLGARKTADMIGFIDRLLADRGLSPTAINQLSLTRSSPAYTTQPQQHQRKKKKLTASLAARKLVPVALAEEGGDDQEALQLVPISELTSGVDESLAQIKEEIAYSGNDGVTSQAKKAKVVRGARRYAFNERLGQRIQDQLCANEVFPDIHIPLPREHLMFDPSEYPLLAKEHELFWQKGTAAYLDMVYYHPVAGDHGRIAQSKKRLLHRQRELLSKYIETLGINVVARKFQTQDSATFPFFFVKLINSLNTLSSEQLDEHLECMKEPWRSPVTQAHGVPWWEALLRTTSSIGVKKHSVLEISDAAKQQIASAHFRGALGFDTHWLRLSTQPPWKEMLDEYKRSGARVEAGASPAATITTANASDDDDEHEHGLPQSPPHRKKVAGKVPINRESMKTSNGDAERRLWLQQLVGNRKDDHAELSGCSTSSDDEDDVAGAESGAKLGKRLRTSNG
ncbi:hypothetical protein Gpo141_00006563 [Globisporangium polare]